MQSSQRRPHGYSKWYSDTQTVCTLCKKPGHRKLWQCPDFLQASLDRRRRLVDKGCWVCLDPDHNGADCVSYKNICTAESDFCIQGVQYGCHHLLLCSAGTARRYSHTYAANDVRESTSGPRMRQSRGPDDPQSLRKYHHQTAAGKNRTERSRHTEPGRQEDMKVVTKSNRNNSRSTPLGMRRGEQSTSSSRSHKELPRKCFQEENTENTVPINHSERYIARKAPKKTISQKKNLTKDGSSKQSTESSETSALVKKPRSKHPRPWSLEKNTTQHKHSSRTDITSEEDNEDEDEDKTDDSHEVQSSHEVEREAYLDTYLDTLVENARSVPHTQNSPVSKAGSPEHSVQARETSPRRRHDRNSDKKAYRKKKQSNGCNAVVVTAPGIEQRTRPEHSVQARETSPRRYNDRNSDKEAYRKKKQSNGCDAVFVTAPGIEQRTRTEHSRVQAGLTSTSMSPHTGRYAPSSIAPSPPDQSDIITKAIYVARQHGITLRKGNPNKRDGDCLYESIIDNINHRPCFTTKLRQSATDYRLAWNTDGQELLYRSVYYPGAYSHDDWKSAFETLATTKQYNLPFFGDLVILNCAHYIKKDILIINTPWEIQNVRAHGPINVIKYDCLDASNQQDGEIPLVLAYNGNHYESLFPVTETDVHHTVSLVKSYTEGEYEIPKALEEQFAFSDSNSLPTTCAPKPAIKRKAVPPHNLPDHKEKKSKGTKKVHTQNQDQAPSSPVSPGARERAEQEQPQQDDASNAAAHTPLEQPPQAAIHDW